MPAGNKIKQEKENMKKERKEKDYQKLGFKCGIEIHQQLEGSKLFCSCPCEIRKDSPDFTIKRKLKASAGESGKVDAAALYEQSKSKYFIYQGYYDTTCLVETDDEPPHAINNSALYSALQISKILNARINDRIQFMRKVVVDGSNVSGFQRTALVARDGKINVDGVDISIPTICLEEEACQAIERKDSHDVYNLSRQGIPLIEIATGPEIISPNHCKNTASYLGMVLRSIGNVKRGLGTIRQDVNISIKDGARTEIKGFQDLNSIPKIIDYEIDRQINLIKAKKEVKKEVRKAEPDFTTSFLRPMPGSARMYPETDVRSVDVSKSMIDSIKIPDLINDRVSEIEKKYSLSRDIAESVIKKNINLESFVVKYPNIPARFIAETIINSPKEIKKRYSLDIDILSAVSPVFDMLNAGKINREAVFEILLVIAQGKKPDYSAYSAVSEEEIRKEIRKIMSEGKKIPEGAVMGMIMSKYRGKIDGRKVMELIKKEC